MNSKKLTLIAFLLFTVINCFSQTNDPVKDTAKSESSLTFNLLYSSNTVYLGRYDANYKSYLNPGLTYLNKTGLFVSLNSDYYPELKTNNITDYSFEAGYQFKLVEQLTGSVYFSSMHSNANSAKVNSGVGNTFGTYLSYDNDILNIGSGLDFSRGKFSDVQFTPNINKSIDFSFGTFFQFDASIDPTLTLSYGSQNFYRYYLIDRKYKNATVIARINEHLKEMQKFQLLDYEFSVPVTLTYNKLSFNATPFYIIPENQPNFKGILPLLPGYKVSTSTFYLQFGISYQF